MVRCHLPPYGSRVRTLLVVLLLLTVTLPAAADRRPRLRQWTPGPPGRPTAAIAFHASPPRTQPGRAGSPRPAHAPRHQAAQNRFQLQPSWSPDGRRVRRCDRTGSERIPRCRQDGLGGARSEGPPVTRRAEDRVPARRRRVHRRRAGCRRAARRRAEPGRSRVGADVTGSRSRSATRARWRPGLVPAHAISRAKLGATTPSWLPDGPPSSTPGAGLTRTALTGRSVLLQPAAWLGAAVSPSGTIVLQARVPAARATFDCAEAQRP